MHMTGYVKNVERIVAFDQRPHLGCVDKGPTPTSDGHSGVAAAAAVDDRAIREQRTARISRVLSDIGPAEAERRPLPGAVS
jgi:hypothetical protein